MKSFSVPEGLHAQAKMLHHALRLPVWVYADEQLVARWPQEGPLPAGLPALAARASMGPLGHLWQLTTPGQAYIALRYGESCCVLLGPFVEGEGSDLPPDGPQAADQRLSESQSYYVRQVVAALLLPRAMTPEAADQPQPPSLQARMASLFQHPPYFLELELSRYIARGDAARALITLREINRLQRARVAPDPLRSLKNSLIGSCALCSRAAIAGGMRAEAAFGLADEYILRIEEALSMPALLALEEGLVTQLAHRVAGLRRSDVSGLTLAALQYIDDHLMDRLRVPDIAASVFVHPDYLSAHFKRQMGEGISVYIQKRRVQEACRFLRHSQYTLADISHFFQFSSQSAFTQVFKRHMGMTPLRYRRSRMATPSEVLPPPQRPGTG